MSDGTVPGLLPAGTGGAQCPASASPALLPQALAGERKALLPPLTGSASHNLRSHPATHTCGLKGPRRRVCRAKRSPGTWQPWFWLAIPNTGCCLPVSLFAPSLERRLVCGTGSLGPVTVTSVALGSDRNETSAMSATSEMHALGSPGCQARSHAREVGAPASVS